MGEITNLTAIAVTKFPWYILIPYLFIPLVPILFFTRRRHENEKDVIIEGRGEIQPSAEDVKEDILASISEETGVIVVDLDDEIRQRAQELYEQRGGHDGNSYEDWYKAYPEIRAKYEAQGYSTQLDPETWRWKAFKTFKK
jgi:hypothetical protein